MHIKLFLIYNLHILNTYIEKENKSSNQQPNFSSYKQEKTEQSEHKAARRKKIIIEWKL